MLRIRKKGQSSLEYVFLLIVVMGALLAVQNYFKRGMQGRWRESVDSLGDQYDPRFGNSDLRQILMLNTVTSITTFNDENGFYTTRVDVTNSIERKTGYLGVMGY